MVTVPSSPLTRFAPSPTWHMHLGHAASAFHVWDFAEKVDADVLLRIENIDHTRCRPEFERSIEDDLKWLGLSWTGSVRRQSEHIADYEAVIRDLDARGLVYKCFKTRSEIAEGLPLGHDREPVGYVGHPLPASEQVKRINAGDPFAWRLSLNAAKLALGARYDALSYQEQTLTKSTRVRANPEPFGDVVLKRKDIPTSYHVACCHDDALQGVTHIVRGEDLREVTSIHVLLQTLMGWPSPVYKFHPLIMGNDGRKLSKRNQDRSLREYRADGVTPTEIRRMTGLK